MMSGHVQAAELSPRGRCPLSESLRRKNYVQVIEIPSHSSLEDRIKVARRLKEEMEIDSKVEVLVDGMEDAFNKEFAAWPIRYFIAKEGRLLHKTENSINNSLFDQVSIQNFFRGFGFVRPFQPMHGLPLRTMAHFSSTGNSCIAMHEFPVKAAGGLSKSSPAPSVPTEAVHVSLEEKILMTVGRDG
jgi:hypothetical protein